MPTYEEYEQAATLTGMIIVRHSWEAMTDEGRQKLFDLVTGKLKPLPTYDELARQHQEAVARAEKAETRLATPGYPLGLSRADVLDVADNVCRCAKREAQIIRSLLHMVDDRDEKLMQEVARAEKAEQQLTVLAASLKPAPKQNARQELDLALKIRFGFSASDPLPWQNFTPKLVREVAINCLADSHTQHMVWQRQWADADDRAAELAQQLAVAGAAEPWVKINETDDSTYPTDHGIYDFATTYKIYLGGYFGSSRYGVGSWYLSVDDEQPPYSGIKDVTHWRRIKSESNPNDLLLPAAPPLEREAAASVPTYADMVHLAIIDGPVGVPSLEAWTALTDDAKRGLMKVAEFNPQELKKIVGGAPLEGSSPAEPQEGEVWRHKKKGDEVLILPRVGPFAICYRRHPSFSNSDFNRARTKQKHYFLHEYEKAAGSPASEKGGLKGE